MRSMQEEADYLQSRKEDVVKMIEDNYSLTQICKAIGCHVEVGMGALDAWGLRTKRAAMRDLLLKMEKGV